MANRECLRTGRGTGTRKSGEALCRSAKRALGEPPERAILLPLIQAGSNTPAGIFIAGINPFRPFDDTFRSFAVLFAGQLTAAIGHVRAYQAERRRAEALAELDRAKTTFFSNVSH